MIGTLNSTPTKTSSADEIVLLPKRRWSEMKKIVFGLVLIGLFSPLSYAGKYGTAVTHGGKAKITKGVSPIILVFYLSGFDWVL